MVSVLFQYYPVAFLTLWHFQSVQECKVCNGIIPKKMLTDTAILSAFYGRKNEKCKTLCNGKRCYFQWVAGRFEGDFWHSENVILVGFAWILLGFSRLKV